MESFLTLVRVFVILDTREVIARQKLLLVHFKLTQSQEKLILAALLFLQRISESLEMKICSLYIMNILLLNWKKRDLN